MADITPNKSTARPICSQNFNNKESTLNNQKQVIQDKIADLQSKYDSLNSLINSISVPVKDTESLKQSNKNFATVVKNIDDSLIELNKDCARFVENLAAVKITDIKPQYNLLDAASCVWHNADLFHKSLRDPSVIEIPVLSHLVNEDEYQNMTNDQVLHLESSINTVKSNNDNNFNNMNLDPIFANLYQAIALIELNTKTAAVLSAFATYLQQVMTKLDSFTSFVNKLIIMYKKILGKLQEKQMKNKQHESSTISFDDFFNNSDVVKDAGYNLSGKDGILFNIDDVPSDLQGFFQQTKSPDGKDCLIINKSGITNILGSVSDVLKIALPDTANPPFSQIYANSLFTDSETSNFINVLANKSKAVNDAISNIGQKVQILQSFINQLTQPINTLLDIIKGLNSR